MLASKGGRTWLGMKFQPYVRMAWVRRPGVLIRIDHPCWAWTRGLIARAKAWEQSWSLEYVCASRGSYQITGHT